MNPQPYGNLPDPDLCALCIWREARGESYLAKRGVAHVIWNRAQRPCWWGRDVRSVILKPYQFSSFNLTDPNEKKWPADSDPAWQDCLSIAVAVLGRDPAEQNDMTGGAVFYFSLPLTEPPKAWGPVQTTVQIDHLTFCRPANPPPNNSDDVDTALAGE